MRYYTQADLRAGLVTKKQIADRVGVDEPNVANWSVRYDDWPEAFLPRLYWWHEVQAFLRRHHLPGKARR